MFLFPLLALIIGNTLLIPFLAEIFMDQKFMNHYLSTSRHWLKVTCFIHAMHNIKTPSFLP